MRIQAKYGFAVDIKVWLSCMIGLAFIFLGATTHAAETGIAAPKWIQHVGSRLHDIWTKGDDELYLTGYAWHNRYTYSKARLKTYNENAWGGGWGRAYLDEVGDWHSLFAFAFLDSHSNLEPVVGYSFLKMMHLRTDFAAGLGLSALVTARPDIYHNIPFPGILPFIGLKYHHAWLQATYIPGAKDAGNVLFLMAKWTF